jgi:hypothetical protein
MDEAQQRTAIFISHATPEDNAFVRWLGAKLSVLGYEVWADLFALHGGSDWSRKLEDALRHRALKMLLVCTPDGLEKQGVRNEIEIATAVGKSISDLEFIVPLRLASYDAPFRIAHLQYIDFSHGWVGGFIELSELLSANKAIPRTDAGKALDEWLSDQTSGAAKLIKRTEYLVSNWLRIKSLPETLYCCEPPFGFDVQRFQMRDVEAYPLIPFKSGVLTFAPPNAAGELRPGVPARVIGEIELSKIQTEGWLEQGIERYVASRLFSDLGNQAFDLYMHRLGMSALANQKGRRTWWADIRLAPKTKVSFNWRHVKGLRQIMGQSEKRNVFWHYGLNAQTRDYPKPHIRLSPRLLFSTNGMDIIDDPKKAHRLRRSFAASWRNARWRDMLLAYLWWVSGGTDEIALPVSSAENLVVSLPPFSPVAQFGAQEAGNADVDEDDPDIDYGNWYEDEGESGEE